MNEPVILDIEKLGPAAENEQIKAAILRGILADIDLSADSPVLIGKFGNGKYGYFPLSKLGALGDQVLEATKGSLPG